MQRRDQPVGRESQGFTDKADVIIDQRLRQGTLVGIPIQACGQRFAEADLLPLLRELLSNPENQSGLAAEGLTGSDQQRRSHEPQVFSQRI